MPPRLLGLAVSLLLVSFRGEPWLPRYDLSKDAARVEHLADALEEVSGLATDAGGRIFAHEDETAVVYQLDPADGRVLKRFRVGGRKLRGDFEGIAIAGRRFFLMTSDGLLLEFSEGEDGEVVPAREKDTGLGERCELEGLAWEPATTSLLVPCKVPKERGLRGRLVVFSVPLATLVPDSAPRVLLPLGELKAVGLEDDFHPSAIEVHPRSGALFLAAGREAELLELSSEGRPLAGARLRRSRHPQTEGLAFAQDLSLLLADEGGHEKGLLTTHPLRERGGGGVGTASIDGREGRAPAERHAPTNGRNGRR